jgi:hypothetical protein
MVTPQPPGRFAGKSAVAEDVRPTITTSAGSSVVAMSSLPALLIDEARRRCHIQTSSRPNGPRSGACVKGSLPLLEGDAFSAGGSLLQPAQVSCQSRAPAGLARCAHASTQERVYFEVSCVLINSTSPWVERLGRCVASLPPTARHPGRIRRIPAAATGSHHRCEAHSTWRAAPFISQARKNRAGTPLSLARCALSKSC